VATETTSVIRSAVIWSVVNHFRIFIERTAKYRYIGTTDRMRGWHDIERGGGLEGKIFIAAELLNI